MDPQSGALLPPAAAQQFAELIIKLNDANNSIRREAEAIYNETKSRAPEQLVLSLLHLALSDADVATRLLCAVMLRQELGRPKSEESWTWTAISNQTQDQIKRLLLCGLQAEKTPEIRRKISDVVSELGLALLDDGGWPDLFPFLFNLSDSPDEGLRISAMEIFGTVTTRVPEQNISDMILFLEKKFADPSLKVRVASLGILNGLLQLCDDSSPEFKRLQAVFPVTLEILAGTLHMKDDDSARLALELLVDLAEFHVLLLRPNVMRLIELMMMIAKSADVDESLRHLSIEVLVTLSESKPGMVRKIPNLLPELFSVLLEWMTHLEENPQWNVGEAEDCDDTDAAIAEESLDRLSMSLAGETVAPILFSAIPNFLGSGDWRFRHAGLMAISVSGEGAVKYLSQHLQDVVGMIHPFFSDVHPRVRWAACNTIGQMCSDFSPEIQQNFHQPILSNIIQVMNDAENPRVQSHAASAIVNFCEECPGDLLTPYLSPLLEKLHSLLQSPKIVQEQVVTAVAALADCAGQQFMPYYDYFVPFLKEILKSALSAEFHVLRSKAIECISIIGVAVGKEKFLNDCQEVIKFLHALNYQPNDPEMSSMMLAWARLCRCLGKDFEPYLDLVMPTLLNSAQTQPPVEVVDTDDVDSLEGEDGWEFIPLGDQTFCIKTSALEEKETACNILFCFAEELKEKFFRFVGPVAEVFVPCLTFGYADGVRNTAASIIPCLLRSTIDYLKENGQESNIEPVLNLWNFVHPKLLTAMRKEIEADSHVAMLESFSECIDLVGVHSHTPETMKKTNELLHEILTKYLKLRDNRHKQGETEEDFDEFDAEKMEEQNDKEDDIISLVAECLGKLFKYFKSNYLPYFQNYAAQWKQLLVVSTRPRDIQMILCLFDDVGEHLQAESVPIVHDLFNHYGRFCEHESPDVRQAAVFGVGVFGQYCGQSFGPVSNAMCNVLLQVASLPDARDQQNVFATENAISSLGKICLYQSQVINFQKFVAAFVTLLPVCEDQMESKVIYTNLCNLIEQQSAAVFGANFERLSNILFIFGTVLGTELIEPQTAQRIALILNNLQTSCPSFRDALAQIGEEQRGKLVGVMSS